MFDTLSTPLQTKTASFMLQTRKWYFFPGSRIRLKEFKYFNPNKWFLSTQKYDPGFLPIPDPGSRIQGSKSHRISDPGSGSATL
jgi:hypothetical protein